MLQRTDAEQFAQNLTAYRAAVNGDAGGLEFLRWQSERAVGAPRDDARRLYDSTLASWGLAAEEMPLDNPVGLGFAIPAALAAVDALRRSWGFLHYNAKDGPRLDWNKRAYAAAVGGDTTAMTFLQYKSGALGFGPGPHLLGWPDDGDGVGRVEAGIYQWGSTVARDDAQRLYTEATRVVALGGGPTPVYGPDGRPIQTLPPHVTLAGMNYGPLVLAGLALAVFTSQRSRR